MADFIFAVVSSLFGIFLPILVARISWVVTWQEKQTLFTWAKALFYLSSQIPQRVYEKQVLGKQGSWLSLLPVQCPSSDSEASTLDN